MDLQIFGEHSDVQKGLDSLMNNIELLEALGLSDALVDLLQTPESMDVVDNIESIDSLLSNDPESGEYPDDDDFSDQTLPSEKEDEFEDMCPKKQREQVINNFRI